MRRISCTCRILIRATHHNILLAGIAFETRAGYRIAVSNEAFTQLSARRLAFSKFLFPPRMAINGDIRRCSIHVWCRGY